MSFSFTPATGLNDTTQFPRFDPLSRQHMQALLDQVKDCINNDLKTPQLCKAARSSTSQSLASGTETAIVFDSKIFDTNNMYSTTKITIKTAGKYLITATGMFQASSPNSRNICIRANGSIRLVEGTGSAAPTNVTRINCNTFVQFSVNDYLELLLWHDSGSALTVQAELTILKVSD